MPSAPHKPAFAATPTISNALPRGRSRSVDAMQGRVNPPHGISLAWGRTMDPPPGLRARSPVPGGGLTPLAGLQRPHRPSGVGGSPRPHARSPLDLQATRQRLDALWPPGAKRPYVGFAALAHRVDAYK